MKITHFLYCPFTGLGLRNGYRGDQWLSNRIAVFLRFVLPSLQNQSNKNFILWISWRPEEFNNPIVQNFMRQLSVVKEFTTIHTFNGLCFWDDKYPDDVAGKRLLGALEQTLPLLTQFVGDAERVLMTIQPSDDMYYASAVKEIQSLQDFVGFDRGAVGFFEGYIMNYATKELAEYNPRTSPPFYTIVFDPDVFLNPVRHYKFIGPYKSHEYVKNHMHFSYIAKRGFVVGTHGENISTTFNHPYKGRTLEGEEKEKVLISIGAWQTPPLVIKRPGRLIARRVLNAIPGNGILRKTYHKLPPKWQIF